VINMREGFICQYCGFRSEKVKQYARHFRSLLTCRQKLHEDITEALKSNKRIIDIAAEFGVDRSTVHRCRVSAVSKQANTPGTVSIGRKILLSAEDIRNVLSSSPSDVSIRRITRTTLIATAEAMAGEIERLEKELGYCKRELSTLKMELDELQRAKAKVEEERDRAVKIHNDLVIGGRLEQKIAKEKVHNVLAEIGW
jgi:hypothetical protein